MDELVKKLEGLGVPSDVLSGLKEKLGDNFVTDIQSLGLKGAAEKAGIDVSTLPDIDMTAVKNFGKEIMGTDVDGDEKTGVEEALDMAKDLADTVKMSEALETVTDAAKEAMGTDVDGDGKTGVADAAANIKDAVTSNATVQSATEKVEEMKDKVASSDLGQKAAEVGDKALAAGNGLLSKIKSFFGA
ncbi:hypothetical protein KBB25_02800 [Candidatus Gracilibacteria bacterium]|nr:hypothetical protein [Candidatus Gracilibacteria bacterium]